MRTVFHSALLAGALTATAICQSAASGAQSAAQANGLPISTSPVGVAADPSRWEVSPGAEFLAKIEELRRGAADQVAAVRSATKAVDEALAEARRNPGSEPSRRLLLEASMRGIDAVQTAVQSMLAQGPALDGAYAQDVDRLRRLDKQRGENAAQAASDLQAVKTETDKLQARIAAAIDSGNEDEIDACMIEEARLQNLADYHASTVGTAGYRERTLTGALARLREARMVMKLGFAKLDGYSKKLSAATQLLEAVAENVNAQKVAEPLAGLGRVAADLVGDGGLPDTIDQVVQTLLPPDGVGIGSAPQRRSSREDWIKEKREQFARKAKNVEPAKTAEAAPPAGGGK